MSVAYDNAEKIAEVLRSAPKAGQVPVLVMNQSDLSNDFKIAIGKGKGCIVIDWTGSANNDEIADEPRLVGTYTATLFTAPVLRRGEVTADDILEDIAVSLHDHRPNGQSSMMADRWVVTSMGPVGMSEDNKLLVYQATIRIPIQLPFSDD